MIKPVYITQAMTVTSLGQDLESLYNGLMASKSGIAPVTRMDTQSYASSYAGCIESLEVETPTPLIWQLADMLIDQLGVVNKDAFLITASTKAGIDDLDDSIGSSGSVSKDLSLSSLNTYISKKLMLESCGVNINSACASSTIAIAKGADLIASGSMDSVLICSLDTVSEFVFSGFSCLGAMSDTPARPFDKNRSGLTLGEGAAAIMLMNPQKAQSLKKTTLARLTGWGIANDAAHLTAPAKDGCGLKLAIRKACEKSRIQPDEITAFNTHGTGTIYNDAMELQVIEQLFNPDKIAANSIKGAIGHTLGAAGGIETALCVKMLEKLMMTPTIGLCDPEKKAQNIFSRDPQTLTERRILTTNSGFGGINAALILEGT